MSRISLMVLGFIAIVCVHVAMTAPRVSVGEASARASSIARGGAAACAMDYPGGFCAIDVPLGACSAHVCDRIVTTAPGAGSAPLTYVTYECNRMGVFPDRIMWWHCLSTNLPPFLLFSSTTCGPPTPGWCYEKKACDNDCLLNAAGVRMCQLKLPAPNFAIHAGFFEEQLGDGVYCMIIIGANAPTKRPRSMMASALPSFSVDH